MKLTTKLLGFLNRVFNKAPGDTLALRLSYDGGMSWRVADGVLTTTVSGGSGAGLTVDLSGYTLASLAGYLASQPGYSVPFVTSDPDLTGVSALALIDGGADIATSNGDHLQAYTSALWAIMEPQSYQLTLARQAIAKAPRELSVPTAEGEWLDELGSQYGIPRNDGELDGVYAARMIATIGRPLANNVAMEAAINVVTGGLRASVVDAPARAFTSPYAGTSYGLFDVVYSIALDSSDDFGTYTSRVRAVVDAYRAAGTHMRTLAVNGTLADTYPTGTIDDSSVSFRVKPEMLETFQLEGKRHNGQYRRDGSFVPQYNGAWDYSGAIVYGTNPGAPITFNNSGEELVITITQAGVPQPPERV